MAKISTFYCRHKISIGSPRCWSPQGTLTEGLGAVIDSDIIHTVHPTSLCTIHAMGNRSWNSDDLWHFCLNCKILEIAVVWPMVNNLKKNLQVWSLFNSGSAGWGLWFSSRGKNLAQFRVRMAKISRFHCRHKISIACPQCRAPQGTLIEGLGAVIDSDIIYTFYPTSLCTIHATGNRSWNSDDLRHFRLDCKILEIWTQLCGLW